MNIQNLSSNYFIYITLLLKNKVNLKHLYANLGIANNKMNYLVGGLCNPLKKSLICFQ